MPRFDSTQCFGCQKPWRRGLGAAAKRKVQLNNVGGGTHRGRAVLVSLLNLPTEAIDTLEANGTSAWYISARSTCPLPPSIAIVRPRPHTQTHPHTYSHT